MGSKKDWRPRENDRLWSNHFEDNSIYRTSKKVMLLDDAIPTMSPVT